MAAITQPRPANSAGIRAPLFILGVALALVAFIVMFAFGLLFANRTVSGATVSVVATSQAIDARAPISALDLKMVTIQQSAAPPGYFTKQSDLSTYYAIVDIPAGQVISGNIVTANPDVFRVSTPYLRIPKGWIALTLPTNELQGVAGYIREGDYINVVATVNTQLFDPKQRPRQVTRTVFTEVHVIQVGPSSSLRQPGQPVGVTSSITVVMPLCDAQYMEWLRLNATITYVLLNYTDYDPKPEEKPSAACPDPSVAPPVVGPTTVNARWSFLQG
jgi:Flp pilus assembly protein CpaB